MTIDRQPARAAAPVPGAALVAAAALVPAAVPATSERRTRKRRETPAKHAPEPIKPAHRDTVQLVDLSTHGCCLGFSAPTDYRPGQFIRLGFAGTNGNPAEPVRAIVRWIEGARIGAEFTSGLPAGQIDAIMTGGQSPFVGLL